MKKPNDFQCPYCKYGYYADKDKFFLVAYALTSDQIRSGYKVSDKRVYACPECGGVFMEIK